MFVALQFYSTDQQTLKLLELCQTIQKLQVVTGNAVVILWKAIGKKFVQKVSEKASVRKDEKDVSFRDSELSGKFLKLDCLITFVRKKCALCALSG